MATLNINNTDNQVTAVNANQSIIITDNGSTTQTSIAVTQPVTSVVLVNTLGPQGTQGPSGSGGTIDTSSFVTTSSFNVFTSSIQSQITSLTNATSSYILNSQTSSMAVSSSLTSSFLTPGTYTVTASQALTSSYSTQIRSGAVGAGVFSGTPLTSSFITLSPSFPSTTYSVSITGTNDARNWTILNKASNGFRISTNSSTPLTTNVMWVAIYYTQ